MAKQRFFDQVFEFIMKMSQGDSCHNAEWLLKENLFVSWKVSVIKSNLRNSGFDFAKKRGKEAAVINQLELYLILKIKALGRWVASHDEYYPSQVCPCCFGVLEKVPNYHLRVHECQTCKKHFHRDTGSAQLMARIVWSLLDRTWSDDEDNPVPPIMRRWQPPTALQDQPARIALIPLNPNYKLLLRERKEKK
jgi:hypothetical protein